MSHRIVLALSSDEIEEAVAGGGPTFHPLHRNRFRCNQVPRLTRLSKHYCEVIRKMAHPKHHISPLPLLAVRSILYARRLKDGSFNCPKCKEPNQRDYSLPKLDDLCVCVHCGQQNRIAYVDPLLGATVSAGGNVTCPHCGRLNYNSGQRYAIHPEPQRCVSCQRWFSAKPMSAKETAAEPDLAATSKSSYR